jgi:hypothetical protein
VPEARPRDAICGILLETSDQRGLWIPTRWCDR